jgi:predicted metal-binding membrane protein
MWVVMMAAMMLPSLVPVLSRYRRAVAGAGEPRLGLLTALVGGAYFFIWTMFGIGAYLSGISLAALAVRVPALAAAAPSAMGAVILMAGLLQISTWKARHLICCREVPGRGRMLPDDAETAWRYGLRLGLHCTRCCFPMTLVLLVVGVMDLLAMTAVAAAITLERLAPTGERVARSLGLAGVGAGLFVIARALGQG